MKQHYIPRCYLKRFSENEKCIYTYDKIHCRKYNASLMSVCCEDDLYTISDKYVKKSNEEGKSKINSLSIEIDHFAHTVEPLYAQFLKQIDDIKESGLQDMTTTDLIILRKGNLLYISLHSIFGCRIQGMLWWMTISGWSVLVLIW